MSSYVSGAMLNMASPYAYAYSPRPVSYSYTPTTYAPAPAQSYPYMSYTPVYYVPVAATPPAAAPVPPAPPAIAPTPAPVVTPPPTPTAPVVPPPVPIESTASTAITTAPVTALKPADSVVTDINTVAKPVETLRTPRQIHRDKLLKAAELILESNPSIEAQVFDALPEPLLDEAIAAKGEQTKLLQVAMKAAMSAKTDALRSKLRNHLPRILGGTKPVIKPPVMLPSSSLLDDVADTDLNLSA